MSEVNTHESAENNGGGQEHAFTVKAIWRVFWFLLLITVIEVVWGMKISHHISEKWINAVFFLSMTLVKAYGIVAYFMHLRYEVKNMIRSILIPLLLFIWFVVAFCADGTSWFTLRSRYSPHDAEKARTEKPAEQPASQPEGTLK
jgi:cytochrome c oxidase subunit IV